MRELTYYVYIKKSLSQNIIFKGGVIIKKKIKKTVLSSFLYIIRVITRYTYILPDTTIITL